MQLFLSSAKIVASVAWIEFGRKKLYELMQCRRSSGTWFTQRRQFFFHSLSLRFAVYEPVDKWLLKWRRMQCTYFAADTPTPNDLNKKLCNEFTINLPNTLAHREMSERDILCAFGQLLEITRSTREKKCSIKCKKIQLQHKTGIWRIVWAVLVYTRRMKITKSTSKYGCLCFTNKTSGGTIYLWTKNKTTIR